MKETKIEAGIVLPGPVDSVSAKAEIERVVKEHGSRLAHYSAARKEIQVCAKVDEVKKIMGKAAALRAYAAQAQDVEIEKFAKRIRLRAERRAGELLVEMKASGTRAKKGQPRKSNITHDDITSKASKTLDELGVTPNQSSQWQKIAEVPEAKFEKIVESDNPSRAAVLSKAEGKTEVGKVEKLTLAGLAAKPIPLRKLVRLIYRVNEGVTLLLPLREDEDFRRAISSPGANGVNSDFGRACMRVLLTMRELFGNDVFNAWLAE